MRINSENLIAVTFREKFGKSTPFEEHPEWDWRNARQVETTCSNCGQNSAVWCLCADAGVIEFCDEFYHICLNVNHNVILKFDRNIRTE